MTPAERWLAAAWPVVRGRLPAPPAQVVEIGCGPLGGFQRLGPDEEAGWLHRRRDEWVASGQSWRAYVRAWAGQERLHSAKTLLRLLDERFQRVHLAQGPYFFPDLAQATEEDERAAIAAGQIQPTRIDYVGRLR